MAAYDAKKASIWYAKNHTVAMMHSGLKMEKYCNFLYISEINTKVILIWEQPSKSIELVFSQISTILILPGVLQVFNAF